MKFDRPFRHLDADEKDKYLKEVRARLQQLDEFWVFGYGSLMWRPCYHVAESCRAQLAGFARRLCVWTIEARGTPQLPGLGLGLQVDINASCQGVVQRVAKAEQEAALAALWEREMLTGIYRPKWLTVETEVGRVSALGFVVDPTHPQYAGDQSIQSQAEYVAFAVGKLGSCLSYVEQSIDAMDALGIRDADLHRLLTRSRRLASDKGVT